MSCINEYTAEQATHLMSGKLRIPEAPCPTA